MVHNVPWEGSSPYYAGDFNACGNVTTYNWTSASRTDAGSVRDRNEDAVLDRPDVGLWAVADGMGGHIRGDLASRAIVDRLAALHAPRTLSQFVTAVEIGLLEVNANLRKLAESSLPRTIGSTVVTLMLRGDYGVCMWAGDSRAYRLRKGELVQLTQDHALVEDLVENGFLDRSQADSHPQAHLVTRAVGASNALELDLEIFDVRERDMFILCSDGLNKTLSYEDIAALACDCLAGRVTQPPAEALIERALARGARDNVTVSAVIINEPTASHVG